MDGDENKDKLVISGPTSLAPFKRSDVPGLLEHFADAALQADPKRVGWMVGAVSAGATAVGITAAAVWHWFGVHAVYVLGPAFVVVCLMFVALVLGARRREQRLLQEVNDHTRKEVSKAVESRRRSLELQGRALSASVEAELQAAWDESNPLGRLLRPIVLSCSLQGATVKLFIVAVNIYHSQRMLRCETCTVFFNDGSPAQCVARIDMPPWAEPIPPQTAYYEIPQPRTIPQPSLSVSELIAVQDAQRRNTLKIYIETTFSTRVGREGAEHDVTIELPFQVALV